MQMMDDDDLNPQLQDPELQTREKTKEKKRKTKKTCSCCSIIGSLWTAKVLFNLQTKHFIIIITIMIWVKVFLQSERLGSSKQSDRLFLLVFLRIPGRKVKEKKSPKESTRSSCRLSVAAAAEESSLKELSILD